MSEPITTASGWVALPGGILYASIQDERIRHRSEAYAIPDGDRWVLIDPVQVATWGAITKDNVSGIVLTGPFHQRSAWRWQAATGAAVFCPAGATTLDSESVTWFKPGDPLPGRLRARGGVGPSQPHVSLHWKDQSGQRVAFVGDLVMVSEEQTLSLVPQEHQEDPQGLLETVADLVKEQPQRLLPAHGPPLLSGATEQLSEWVVRLRGG